MKHDPFRRRIALAIPLLGVIPWVRGANAAPAAAWRESRALLGTRVDLVADLADQDQWRQASTAAWAEMARLERMMSRYRPDSALSRLNAAAGGAPVRVPDELMRVLAQARRASAASDGAFDATVGALQAWRFDAGQTLAPDTGEIARQQRLVNHAELILDERAGTAGLRRRGMALDLGGIAKLPILQAGLKVLQDHGIHNALVNGGGDVLISGRNQGRPWKVGLRDPRAPERLASALALSGQAVVASSGDYERFFVAGGRKLHHILDPRTGWPTQRSPGVSLLAREVEQVNGMGAALMVMDADRAQALLATRPGVDALIATSSSQPLWTSGGMARLLAG